MVRVVKSTGSSQKMIRPVQDEVNQKNDWDEADETK